MGGVVAGGRPRPEKGAREVARREAHVLLVVTCTQGGRAHLTTVKKVLQRGLVATAIMLPLILVFHSPAEAQARVVNIPCGQDIDATINADPRGTATRFVLGADCTFVASATIVPSNGDEVACAVDPTFRELRAPASDPDSVFDPTTPPQDPTTRCTVAGNSSVENV